MPTEPGLSARACLLCTRPLGIQERLVICQPFFVLLQREFHNMWQHACALEGFHPVLLLEEADNAVLHFLVGAGEPCRGSGTACWNLASSARTLLRIRP